MAVSIASIDERSTERMHFRTSPRIKRAIQQAASLAGVDDSAFVMNAAYRSAMETIAAHEQTFLTTPDHTAFFRALDNPPSPNARLAAAALRHDAIVATD